MIRKIICLVAAILIIAVCSVSCGDKDKNESATSAESIIDVTVEESEVETSVVEDVTAEVESEAEEIVTESEPDGEE